MKDTCDRDLFPSVSVISVVKLEKEKHRQWIVSQNPVCFLERHFDWTFPVIFQQWKPCWHVHYRLVKDMMIICLFRLKYVFLGCEYIKTPKFSVYPLVAARVQHPAVCIKKRHKVMCLVSVNAEITVRTSSNLSAPLYFTWKPVRKTTGKTHFSIQCVKDDIPNTPVGSCEASKDFMGFFFSIKSHVFTCVPHTFK